MNPKLLFFLLRWVTHPAEEISTCFCYAKHTYRAHLDKLFRCFPLIKVSLHTTLLSVRAITVHGNMPVREKVEQWFGLFALSALYDKKQFFFHANMKRKTIQFTVLV